MFSHAVNHINSVYVWVSYQPCVCFAAWCPLSEGRCSLQMAHPWLESTCPLCTTQTTDSPSRGRMACRLIENTSRHISYTHFHTVSCPWITECHNTAQSTDVTKTICLVLMHKIYINVWKLFHWIHFFWLNTQSLTAPQQFVCVCARMCFMACCLIYQDHLMKMSGIALGSSALANSLFKMHWIYKGGINQPMGRILPYC